MQKGHIQTGTVTGTGAAINISVGFAPARVTLFNIVNATFIEWQDTLPAAAGRKIIAAGTQTYITTLGVSPFAGTVAGVGAGFTIGADALLNVATNAIHWIAISGDA